ncbi:oxidoreductase [Porphyrobacter sp. GA68]|uniref:oxidoreductase n=1 Tax=Porphyrobacter sp. GA68 TaxID=2883480 RepID=UPI001D17EBCD|nr:oxidoreductase [Porphyrobacter sp. GA68]
MTRFRFADIGNQSGKTVLVTGANTGLGFEIGRHLALRGARVLMACRNRAKGEDAIARIESEMPGADLQFLALDLADMESIRAAVDRVANEARLDVLINNAGLMMPALGYAHGVEQQIGVNHLGHFALTGLLLDRLASDGGGRVVTQASIAHRGARLDLDNLDARKGYDRNAFYKQSKLANLLFTLELDRRLRAAGSPVAALACHPGVAKTEIARHVGPAKVVLPLIGWLLNSPQCGALPALQAATDPQAHGGDYFGPYGLAELRGSCSGPAYISGNARDASVARQLWTRSVELTGIDPALPVG